MTWPQALGASTELWSRRCQLGLGRDLGALPDFSDDSDGSEDFSCPLFRVLSFLGVIL